MRSGDGPSATLSWTAPAFTGSGAVSSHPVKGTVSGTPVTATPRRAPRPGGPGRPDNGYTVIEMVTVLFVVSVLLAAQASVVRVMTSVTTRLRSTGDAVTQSRAATDALSRSMPYAERANMPAQVGTTWYVETLTTAVASGASPTCAQWRVDTAADLLQVRTWTQGSSSASAWTTVARDVTNDPTTAPPFAVYPADSTFTLPRISVALALSGPRGGAATARGLYTLRNAVASPAVGTDIVCTEAGRS